MTKIAVGRILKTHGIHGELNVELANAAEPDTDFAPGAALIVEIEGLDVPFFVAASRPRGADSLLLQLDAVGSDAEAAPLVGLTLYAYVDPSELLDPDAEGVHAGELEGYAMLLADTGQHIGRIEAVEELTPGAWYFRLDDERLIPAVGEFIADIDHDARAVAVALPAGLLEL